MKLKVTFRRGECGDELVLEQSRLVGPRFRRFIEAEAVIEGRSFDEQVAEFYCTAEQDEDPDMAVDHTDLFEEEMTEHAMAGWLLGRAFREVDLINFFEGPHNAGCDTAEELEAELVDLRPRLTPEESGHLDAAVAAALRLDGAAVREHVRWLADVAVRWAAEDGDGD